ncbi:MAG TPA: hypothetical protein VFN67_38360 [Polyangiales bacterium]|jgi:hypothetical protein|nr:hypothetical protein [Polyangiales bacterium]
MGLAETAHPRHVHTIAQHFHREDDLAGAAARDLPALLRRLERAWSAAPERMAT